MVYSDEHMECLLRDRYIHSGLDVKHVGDKVKTLCGNVREWRLRVATWNCLGFGNECKQKGIREVLV